MLVTLGKLGTRQGYRSMKHGRRRAYSTLRKTAFYSKNKKRKRCFGISVADLVAYGRFLSMSITSIAPIMIITTIIATIPYMTVLFEAKPASGVAVGAGVGAVALA
jgi:hypothetical protein